MAELLSTCGTPFQVDEADIPFVTTLCWHIRPGAHRYVCRYPNKTTVYLHRLLLGAPRGLLVDHVNNDGLDNRRANLRLATPTENSANRHVRPKLGSFWGVTPWRRKWRAQSTYQNQNVNLGYYDSREEAALARDAFVALARGDFGTFNFPERGPELRSWAAAFGGGVLDHDVKAIPAAFRAVWRA